MLVATSAVRSPPMSRNLNTLLTVAAELRAVGHPWDFIAKQVNRRAATCQKWPARYADRWGPIYRAVQERRFEQTSNQAHTYLVQMMAATDWRARHKALELWMKAGAGAYGREGTMTFHASSPPAAAEEYSLTKPTEEMIEYYTRQVGEARAEFDRQRAEAGLPPCDEGEFTDAWYALQMANFGKEIAAEKSGGEGAGDCMPDTQSPPVASANGPIVAALLVVAAALFTLRPVGSLGQREADDLLVVSGEHALVRVGRVAPDHVPAKTLIGRVEQLRPVDLLVSLRTQPGDHQVSGLAENEVPVAILDQERRPG